MGGWKRSSVWDDAKGAYVDGYEVGGRFWPASGLSVSKVEDGGSAYNVYTDRETGEYVFRRKTSRRSSSKTKCWLYNNTSNVAKDKSLHRVNRRQDYGSIMEYFDDNSEYLQVSAGLNHCVREDIVVDIDDFIGDFETKADYERTRVVHSRLKKRFAVLSDLGFPLPSLFQIHITNGHAQLHYILEYPVKVYHIYQNSRGVLVYRKTPEWYKYRDLIRFTAYLLDGDMMFTGWQIKNPCISDGRLSDDFITYWNAGGAFMPFMRPSCGCVRHCFDDLHSCMAKFMDFRNSEEYARLYSVLNRRKGVGSDELFRFASSHMNCFNDREAVFGLRESRSAELRKANADAERRDRMVDELCYWRSLSRNAFTREYTMKLIRDSKNTIEMDAARSVVWNKLNSITGDDGCLDGTIRREEYCDAEFERDFCGAFTYARDTYSKEYGGWCDKDRSRSAETRRYARCMKMIRMFLCIKDNAEMAADTLAGNAALCPVIGVRSVRTVSSYKRELGISRGISDECAGRVMECISYCSGMAGKANRGKKDSSFAAARDREIMKKAKEALDEYGK